MFYYLAFPFISTGTNGTIDGHLAAQAEILNKADDNTIVVPGHGPQTGKAGLGDTSNRLGNMRGYVAWPKKMGVPRNAARAFYPTFAKGSDWKDGPITDKFFLELVYTTLPQQPEE